MLLIIINNNLWTLNSKIHVVLITDISLHLKCFTKTLFTL